MAEDPPALDVATTALFVELLVIGTGAVGAMSLIVSTCVGWRWLGVLNDVGPLVIFLLSAVYVIGIVTDRLADAIGEPLSARWRKAVYLTGGGDPRNYDADLLTVLENTPLASRLAYGRSRLRICRGWTVSCALAVVTFLVYVMLGPNIENRVGLGFGGEIAVFALGMACALAWYRLALAQYEHVRDQASASGESP